MKRQTKIILIIVAAAAVAVAVWWFSTRKESFTGLATNSVTSMGPVTAPAGGGSDLDSGSGSGYGSANFAEMTGAIEGYCGGHGHTHGHVHGHEHACGPHGHTHFDGCGCDSTHPMDRISKQMLSQIPRVSKNVTPFDVDVSAPSSHMFAASFNPYVSQVKSRNAELGSLSHAIRGDICIKHYPNVAVIEKTRHVPGFDSRHDALYSHVTCPGIIPASGRSFPMRSAGAGQACGYGGRSAGTIMDS